MSRLSSRMVDCLRALSRGPLDKSEVMRQYTGWSVKALLKRGYIAETGSDLFISTTGLSALHLEESDEPQTAGSRVGSSSAEVGGSGLAP